MITKMSRAYIQAGKTGGLYPSICSNSDKWPRPLIVLFGSCLGVRESTQVQGLAFDRAQPHPTPANFQRRELGNIHFHSCSLRWRRLKMRLSSTNSVRPLSFTNKTGEVGGQRVEAHLVGHRLCSGPRAAPDCSTGRKNSEAAFIIYELIKS
jgi:hypothetical protein